MSEIQNNEIKIAVVTHKPYKQFENKYLLPIHAGRSISKMFSKDGIIEDEAYSWLVKNTHGDDLGDNISYKNRSYCELTALYWLWKHEDAKYLGLCHYRRYMCFKENIKDNYSCSERNNGCYTANFINEDIITKYGLDEDSILAGLNGYDAVFINPIDLYKNNIKSNYQAMALCPDYHIMRDVDNMMAIIRNKYPQMALIADKYMMNYRYNYLYNCFVMKRELFNEFCEWLFDILSEMEDITDLSNYSVKQYRVYGLLAERLVGIWYLWLCEQKKYKVKNVPLLFIEYPEPREILFPKFKNNNISIVSNFNNDYAPVFDVCLKSIIDNISDENNYDIIILSEDISDKNKILLKQNLENKNNVSIRFLNPYYYLENVDISLQSSVYTSDLYYRVIIPQILEKYEKLLVIDADTIFREDPANIYNEDLSAYLAGGVKDTVYQGQVNGIDPYSRVEYTLNYMKMDNPYNYINTGILLFNCAEYRKTYSLEFLKDFICTHINKVIVFEQDMLNMLLYGRVKFLDAKWNIFSKTNEWVINRIKGAPKKYFSMYEDARGQSKGIIHYANSPKPWDAPLSDFSELWWKYARQSTYYEYFMSRMGRNRKVINKDTIINLFNWHKNCIKYWKYKFLKNFVFGKTRERYNYKKYLYKDRIRRVKEFIN